MVRFLIGARDFLLLQSAQTDSGAHPTYTDSGAYAASYSVGTAAVGELDHPLRSSV